MGVLTVRNDAGQTFQVDADKIPQAEKDGFLTVVSDGKAEHRVSFDQLHLAEKDGFKPISGITKPQEQKEYDYSNIGQVAKDLGRATIDTLPAVGQMIGSTVGPMGSGAGQAAGESLRQGINGLIDRPLSDNLRLPTKDQALGIVTDQMNNFNLGAGLDLGARGLAAGLKLFPSALKYLGREAKTTADSLNGSTPENLEQVKAAAKNLGVDVLPAMKTTSKAAQDFESGLAQSGSFPARTIRNQYDDFFSGIDKAGEKIKDMGTANNHYSIGKKISDQIHEMVTSNKEPVAEMYDAIQKDLFKIPIDKASVNQEIGALKRNQIFRSKDGMMFLKKMGDDLASSADNLADLKEFRTNIKKYLPKDAPDIDKARLDAFYSSVTNIRNKSIGAASEVVGGGKDAAMLADGLATDLSLADSIHAGNMQDINSLKELVGSKKDFGSSSKFIDKLSEIPKEDLAKSASSLSVDGLKELRAKVPDAFAKAQEAKVNELIQKSTGVKGFNPTTFVKNFNSLGKEFQEIFFSPEAIKHIKDLETVSAAIPEKLGPSGTPKGIMTMDAFNPARNVKDFLIKNIALTPKGSQILDKTSKVLDSTGRGLETFGTVASKQIQGSTVIANEKPRDPPMKEDRFVEDGIKKIKSVDRLGELGASFEYLKESKKGRDLLMRASDFPAGSEGLKKVIEKIKQTDEFKKTIKTTDYPKRITKGNMQAVVKNEREEKEARSEGWL